MVLHYFVCLFLVVGLSKLTDKLAWVLVMVAIIAVGKELYDPVISIGDLVADFIGAVIGYLYVKKDEI